MHVCVAIGGPFSDNVIITTEFVGERSLFIVTKFEHANRMHGQDTGCSKVQTYRISAGFCSYTKTRRTEGECQS